MLLFMGLRVVLAPRILLPLESREYFDARHQRLLDAGLESFVVECHPSFAPGEAEFPLPDWVSDRAGGEWVVVAEHPDFTLRKLRRAR
jgi:hypothetical protein